RWPHGPRWWYPPWSSLLHVRRVRQRPLSSGRRGRSSRYHHDLTDWGGGAGGTRTPDPLHAMQVLSQLSYNPTVGPLIGAIPDARPVRFGLTARRASSASPIAGSHLARLAAVETCAYCSRLNAFRRVYRSPSPTLKARS